MFMKLCTKDENIGDLERALATLLDLFGSLA
jgi:hypothetical protein